MQEAPSRLRAESAGSPCRGRRDTVPHTCHHSQRKEKRSKGPFQHSPPAPRSRPASSQLLRCYSRPPISRSSEPGARVFLRPLSAPGLHVPHDRALLPACSHLINTPRTPAPAAEERVAEPESGRRSAGRGAPGSDGSRRDQRQRSLIEVAISHFEFALITQQTPATAEPQNSRADGEEQLRHFRSRDRPSRMKAGGCEGVGGRVDPVEHQGVEVHVEVQGRAEVLDLDHGTSTERIAPSPGGKWAISPSLPRAPRKPSDVPWRHVQP